jgi:hypothetical protein
MEIRLTEEAQEKMASAVNFDPCVPQGMPGVMANPLPIEFINRGDHIDLQLTAFAVLRRIDMTTRADPDSVPSSDLGYPVGRWAGDTLEVRTTRVSWPYLDNAGRPQTENAEILERFSLTDGRNRLNYTQTVTDPASLFEPLEWPTPYIYETPVELPCGSRLSLTAFLSSSTPLPVERQVRLTLSVAYATR